MHCGENGVLVRSEAFRRNVIHAKLERPERCSLPRLADDAKRICPAAHHCLCSAYFQGAPLLPRSWRSRPHQLGRDDDHECAQCRCAARTRLPGLAPNPVSNAPGRKARHSVAPRPSAKSRSRMGATIWRPKGVSQLSRESSKPDGRPKCASGRKAHGLSREIDALPNVAVHLAGPCTTPIQLTDDVSWIGVVRRWPKG